MRVLGKRWLLGYSHHPTAHTRVLDTGRIPSSASEHRPYRIWVRRDVARDRSSSLSKRLLLGMIRPHSTPVGVLLGLSVVVCAGITACGGSDRPDGSQATEAETTPVTGSEANSSSSERRRAKRHSRRPGRTSIRTSDGIGISLPDRPERVVAKPSSSCALVEDGDGRGTTLLPPRPGVTAARLSPRRVQVVITFRRLPAECRPTHVRLTVDVNDDPLPPATAVYPWRRVREPLVIGIPQRVRNADVLHASSITAEGASSDSAGVLIR